MTVNASGQTSTHPCNLEETGDPEYRFRYLIAFTSGPMAERKSKIFELSQPLHQHEQYGRINADLRHDFGDNIGITGISLLAGPVRLFLPYSHDFPDFYTHLVSYAGRLGGHFVGSCGMVSLPHQLSTRKRLADVAAYLAENSGFAEVKVLTVDLLAFPRPAAGQDGTR